VWTDDALEGEGTTVMLYCLTCLVTDTARVSYLTNLHTNGPFSVIFMDPNAESYDVDLQSLLDLACAQQHIIPTGVLKRSSAPPTGPSPRPTPSERRPPAPTGGPRTSQEHQQSLVDAMSRALEEAVAAAHQAPGGSVHATPTGHQLPSGGASAFGEAARLFTIPHGTSPAFQPVAPPVQQGGGQPLGITQVPTYIILSPRQTTYF